METQHQPKESESAGWQAREAAAVFGFLLADGLADTNCLGSCDR